MLPLSRRNRSIGLSIVLLGCSSLHAPLAQAQAQTDPGTPAINPPTPNPPASQAGDAQSQQAVQTIDADTGAESAVWKKIEAHDFKGWITPTPSARDTITRDAGGWRSTLADAGFGLLFYSVNVGAYDFAQAGKNTPGTLYNGERPMLQASNQTGVLTYDLGRVGLEGGQLIAIANVSSNTFQSKDGINGMRLKGAYWYQPLWHGKAEFELGMITNANDYIGTNVGGSLASGALGPQSSIPVETGMSYAQYDAPTASIKINWTKNLYTRSAIQRSISPKGGTTESNANPIGVTFSVAGAKPLFIQEIGYRINATPGVKSFWLRGGGFYNTSDYALLLGGGTHHNHSGYIAADAQLTQPDHDTPAHGLYVGATFEAAASDVNLIDRYIEGRIYLKAPFHARPHDMASFVITSSHYSRDARDHAATPDLTPFAATQTYTGSYSFQIMHGLYVQPGFSVLVHPVYNAGIGTAVNGLLGLTSFF